MVRGLFKRKKKEEKIEKQVEIEKTSLENICGDDSEVCQALWHTMFLEPQKIDVTLEEAIKKATEFEKQKQTRKARIWYHVAGGLALWKGDVTKVKQYFGKCEKLAPEMDYGLIMKIPEKAVAKAQEYYKKFLG
ncbi:MAG: hypothetical protein JSV05_00935 [Candidatus Bathyarchaeota archaeon]|nr:MAG: hypothetical protein JSV05_00935 [Candidatus Bathyarchaeota archaeon]